MNTMHKTAIVIDSGITVPDRYKNLDNLFILPLRIIFSDCEYRDSFDIDIEGLVERLKTCIPSTSLPSGEDIISIIKHIKDKGFSNILFFTISSKLSGTYGTINNVIQDYKNTSDFSLQMHVIDTKTISVASGLIVVNAINLLNKGKHTSEIIDILKADIYNTLLYFTVDELKYIARGGRINTFAANLGHLLNIKPIISCNSHGEYALVDKVRGKNKSYERIANIVKNKISNVKNYKFYFVYGYNKPDLDNFISIFKKYNIDLKEYFISQVSTSLLVHTGPDALGISVRIYN